jgi:Raf kinase inhibitor-like YbhB/YbcL family protein
VQQEIRIRGVPNGTVELALICHVPDAPLPFGFAHWLLYGIPPETVVLGENAGNDFSPGPNDFGEPGYGGPRTPPGHGPHHYYFWGYVLDTKVDGTSSRTEFLQRYSDHMLEQNRIVGIFSN